MTVNRKIETTWFKRLLCRHRNRVFLRNIYGDELNVAGGNRSWWLCQNCGRQLLHSALNYPSRLELSVKAFLDTIPAMPQVEHVAGIYRWNKEQYLALIELSHVYHWEVRDGDR